MHDCGFYLVLDVPKKISSYGIDGVEGVMADIVVAGDEPIKEFRIAVMS